MFQVGELSTSSLLLTPSWSQTIQVWPKRFRQYRLVGDGVAGCVVSGCDKFWLLLEVSPQCLGTSGEHGTKGQREGGLTDNGPRACRACCQGCSQVCASPQENMAKANIKSWRVILGRPQRPSCQPFQSYEQRNWCLGRWTEGLAQGWREKHDQNQVTWL